MQVRMRDGMQSTVWRKSMNTMRETQDRFVMKLNLLC